MGRPQSHPQLEGNKKFAETGEFAFTPESLYHEWKTLSRIYEVAKKLRETLGKEAGLSSAESKKIYASFYARGIGILMDTNSCGPKMSAALVEVKRLVAVQEANSKIREKVKA